MKRLSLTGLAAVSVLFVVACEPEMDERTTRGREPGGFRPRDNERVVEHTEERTTRQPAPEPDVEAEPSPQPEPAPNPVNVPKPAAPVAEYEYGKNVPGKPGFVTSPYAPYSGYVDVRGFPPGTEVKDPYTGKIFLVP